MEAKRNELLEAEISGAGFDVQHKVFEILDREVMLNMSERSLTETQQTKIEEIKREWIAEIEKLPELPKGREVLDGGGGRYRDLEIKYHKRIMEVMEASE